MSKKNEPLKHNNRKHKTSLKDVQRDMSGKMQAKLWFITLTDMFNIGSLFFNKGNCRTPPLPL